jgi:hypothetical protein
MYSASAVASGGNAFRVQIGSADTLSAVDLRDRKRR